MGSAIQHVHGLLWPIEEPNHKSPTLWLHRDWFEWNRIYLTASSFLLLVVAA